LLFAALLFSGNTFSVSRFAGRDPGPRQIGGAATEARFESIRAITGHGGFLYVADNTSLRRVDIQTRQVTTITRFAGSNVSSGVGYNTPGVKGIWTDGTYAYVTDSSAGRVHRIDINTGQVEISPDLYSGCPACRLIPVQGLLSPTFQLGGPFGIWGDGINLYIAESREGKIKRLSLASGELTDFASPPGPTDPSECAVASCIGYYVPSPRELASDGTYLYVTGYSHTIRRINIQTGEITSLPELPFIPRDLTISAGILYTWNAGLIAGIDLATGSVQTIASPNSIGVMWADNGFIYVAGEKQIDRINIQTGQSENFAAAGPRCWPPIYTSTKDSEITKDTREIKPKTKPRSPARLIGVLFLELAKSRNRPNTRRLYHSPSAALAERISSHCNSVTPKFKIRPNG
jgi:DNA-binding beta-propeller fold protein YncE